MPDVSPHRLHIVPIYALQNLQLSYSGNTVSSAPNTCKSARTGSFRGRSPEWLGVSVPFRFFGPRLWDYSLAYPGVGRLHMCRQGSPQCHSLTLCPNSTR